MLRAIFLKIFFQLKFSGLWIKAALWVTHWQSRIPCEVSFSDQHSLSEANVVERPANGGLDKRYLSSKVLTWPPNHLHYLQLYIFMNKILTLKTDLSKHQKKNEIGQGCDELDLRLNLLLIITGVRQRDPRLIWAFFD